MKNLILAATIFVLLIFQAGVLTPLLGNFGNLILVLVVVSVLSSEITGILFVVLLAGLMLDFISGTVDGTIILTLLVVFGFIYVLINRFIPKEHSNLVLLTCIATSTIAYSLIFIFVNRIFVSLDIDRLVDWKYLLGWKLLGDLVVNLIFTYPIFWLHQTLSHRLSFRKI